LKVFPFRGRRQAYGFALWTKMGHGRREFRYRAPVVTRCRKKMVVGKARFEICTSEESSGRRISLKAGSEGKKRRNDIWRRNNFRCYLICSTISLPDCSCVCVCIVVCVSLCLHMCLSVSFCSLCVCISVCICVSVFCICVCICVRFCVYFLICIRVCVSMCLYVYMCMCLCVSVSVYVYA